MVTPRWVNTRIQPIAIRDVLRYLVGAAELPPEVSRSFDIGGPDVLTYREMMQRLRPGRRPAAAADRAGAGAHPVPVQPLGRPGHAGAELHRPAAGGVAAQRGGRREHDIADYVPDPPEGLLGFDRAVELALQRIRDADVATRWSSASVPGAPSDPLPTDPDWAGGSLYVDRRRRRSTPPPTRCGGSSRASAARAAGTPSRSPGGSAGWPTAWSAASGCAAAAATPTASTSARPSTSGGSRSASQARCCGCAPRCGCPGWPGWSSASRPARSDARSTYVQRAVFHPRGLLGHVYWWAVAPFHGIVFGGMARNIAAAAEQQQRQVVWERDLAAAAPAPRPGRRSAPGSPACPLVLRQQPRLVHVGVVDAGQLLDVAPDVAALRVVPPRLQHDVVGAVEPAVRAGAGHPLPVHRVVGDVAVEQQVDEVLGALAPVDVERLGQEVPDDQPGPVVHPALPRELAHPGVDDRVAGAALLPRRELLVAAVPAVAARPVVGGRRPAAGRRAPGGGSRATPPAGRTPRPPALRCSPARANQLDRRDAAEVQVRRQPRRVVVAQRVVVLVVVGQAVPQPTVHPSRPAVSPPGGQVRRRRPGRDGRERGQPARRAAASAASAGWAPGRGSEPSPTGGSTA